jgi:hypothetical protein
MLPGEAFRNYRGQGRGAASAPALGPEGTAVVGRHSDRRHTMLWGVMAALAGIALAALVAATIPRALGQGRAAERPAAARCATSSTLRVTTATSFAPVLEGLAPVLSRGPDCVTLRVTPLDGRPAARRLEELRTDVWIPDDSAWAAYTPPGVLTPSGQSGAGTIVATSPVYMVTDPATAARVTEAGGSWLGLSGLLSTASGLRLAVRSPAAAGDGLIGAGALGEAVWLRSGMDASSMAMVDTVRHTRMVSGPAPALPGRPGEVALVPEYALLPALGALTDAAVLSGSDRTALMRFTWFPTAVGAGDPARSAALYRVLMSLTGADAAPLLGRAQLRRPDGGPPPDAAKEDLPHLAPASFGVIAPHHADHIFATFYPEERRANLLLVVDVSGSMGDPAPGSHTPLISLVRQGVLSIGSLLPDNSRLGLWSFGFKLAPPRDYRVELPSAPMGRAHRAALRVAVGNLKALDSGTALYDTILDAYRAAQATYHPGIPNQVLFFTDGHDQDDPDAIGVRDLAARLRAVADPKRPVELAIVVFGTHPDSAALRAVLSPVNGYLEPVTSAEQVAGSFVHVAVGGLRTR